MPNQKLPQVRAKHTIAEAWPPPKPPRRSSKSWRSSRRIEPLPDDWFEAPEAKPLPADTLVDRYSSARSPISRMCVRA